MEEGGENNQEDCEKASGEWGKKEEGRSRDVGIKDGEKDGYFGKDRKTRDQRRIEISKGVLGVVGARKSSFLFPLPSSVLFYMWRPLPLSNAHCGMQSLVHHHKILRVHCSQRRIGRTIGTNILIICLTLQMARPSKVVRTTLYFFLVPAHDSSYFSTLHSRAAVCLSCTTPHLIVFVSLSW